jgi:phosphate transport system permease protein
MAIDLRPPGTEGGGDTEPPALAAERPPGLIFDRAFRVLALVGGLLVMVILALIAYSTISKAWPAFSEAGLSYFVSDNWDPTNARSPAFGTLAFSFGTVVISALALTVAVPVSVGIALFVTEIAPGWLRRPVVYVIDLLAAVPSVVYGLWGALVLAPALPGFYQNVHDAVSWVPVLGDVLDGDPISGKAFMTAGLILGVMVVPIITAVTRETFATVPQSQKDAALALGATRWEMIRAAVFPHSRSGMVAAVLIGFGRAVGETIAVALVIGSTPQITEKMFSAGDALPAVIANQFGESTGTYQAALIGMGVVLFMITLLLGIVARAALVRSEHRLGSPS